MTPPALFQPGQVQIGITPTCWTNDDFPLLGNEISFEQCVSEMALAGYRGCSVGHRYPTDPKGLKAALDLRGLCVSEMWGSAYFTVRDMQQSTVDEFRRQLAFIKAMGGTDIGLAELGHSVHQRPVALKANKPVFDDAQWKQMVDGLHRLGEIAAAENMRLCYHHHMGTGVQSRQEVDRLMADTDPALVHLLLDTGHLYWAGDDPVALARDHAERIKHVHLKDIRRPLMEESDRLGRSFSQAILAGVFTVPGDGNVDFAAILGALADSGYQGWLVVEAEQDASQAHPLTYAKMARSHLREVTGL